MGSSPSRPPVPAHGRPSNLFDIDPGVSARVAIAVNVDASDHSGQALTLVMDPRQLTDLLQFDTAGFGQALVAVVDGNGRIIGRSRDEDRFIGAPVPTWDALLAVGRDHGVFEAELLDGDTVTFSFSTIPHTPGWAIVTGMPTAAFEARWREPLAMLAAGSGLAILAGLGLAFFVARRITDPVHSLAAYAESTTREPGEEPVPSRITEYETLRRALVAAQEALLQRANSLALSEERYRAMAKVGSMVTWRRDARGVLVAIDGWHQLTGRPDSDMLGTGFVKSIHPDDYDQIDQSWWRSVADGGPIDVDGRVITADDTWMWIRIRGVCLRDARGDPVEWVGTVEDITASKEQHLRDSFLALHDELTGLPNRGLLHTRLDKARAAAGSSVLSALLFVDLDHFKRANDTYGHAVGDAVLRKVAERMGSLLRPTDLAARLGGDEFAILLHDIDHPEAAVIAGLRLIRALSAAYDIGECSVRIGASIGIAYVADGLSIPDLMKQADAALYEAKSAGRNRCIVFTPEAARQTA